MASLPHKPSKLMMEGFIKIEGRQAHGEMITTDYETGDYAACALGCVYIGLGVSPDALAEECVDTEKLESQLFDGWNAWHPEGGYYGKIPTIIADLNDESGWPVWKISNWLRDSLGL